MSITVPPPEVPFAASDFFDIEEDPTTALSFNQSQLLSNDLAPDPVNSNSLSLTSINNLSPSTGSFSTVADGPLSFNISTGLFTYIPQADFFGLDTFTYTIESSPNAGDGPSMGTVNIDVQPINDGPVNTVPGSLSIDEDNTLSFTGANLITVQDIDAGTDGLTVTLTIGNGTLNVPTGGADVSNNDSGNVSINGTVIQINSTLGGLTYTPQTNFFGGDQLEVNTRDNGKTGGARGNPTSRNPLADVDTVNITIQPINDAPTLVVPGAQSFFTDFDNRFSQSSENQIQIDDVDAANADVQIDLTIGDGTLTISDRGGVSIQNNGTSSVTIRGSVADINRSLGGETVVYRTSTAGDQTLAVTANDLGNTGGGGQQAMTSTVDIAVLNFAPEEPVLIRQSGGSTQLRGSDADDFLRIMPGDDGNSLMVFGAAAGGPIQIQNMRNLTIHLGGGSNRLEILGTDGTLEFPGNVRVIGGPDDDVIIIDPVDVQKNLKINTGDGDELIIADVGVQGRSSVIVTGKGNDRVEVTRTRTRGTLRVVGGPGDDTLILDDTRVDGALIAAMGRGADRVDVLDSVVRKSAKLHLAGGNDMVNINGPRFAMSLVTATAGGDDVVDIFNSIFLKRRVRFSLGGGNDELDAGILSDPNANGNVFDLAPPVRGIEGVLS